MLICRSAKTQWAFYGGPVVGESAIKHLNEVGPKVSHIYQVYNEGPWKVSTVEVRISWPYEVANDKAHGKWLLYMEEMPTIQGNTKVIVPSKVCSFVICRNIKTLIEAVCIFCLYRGKTFYERAKKSKLYRFKHA